MEFATPLLCFYDKAGLAVSKKSETNESIYICTVYIYILYRNIYIYRDIYIYIYYTVIHLFIHVL